MTVFTPTSHQHMESMCHHRGRGVRVHKLALGTLLKGTFGSDTRLTLQIFDEVLIKMLTVFSKADEDESHPSISVILPPLGGRMTDCDDSQDDIGVSEVGDDDAAAPRCPSGSNFPVFFSHQRDNKYRQQSQKQTLPVWKLCRTSPLLGYKCWLSITLISCVNLFCLLAWKSLFARRSEVFVDLNKQIQS